MLHKTCFLIKIWACDKGFANLCMTFLLPASCSKNYKLNLPSKLELAWSSKAVIIKKLNDALRF